METTAEFHSLSLLFHSTHEHVCTASSVKNCGFYVRGGVFWTGITYYSVCYTNILARGVPVGHLVIMLHVQRMEAEDDECPQVQEQQVPKEQSTSHRRVAEEYNCRTKPTSARILG